MYDIAIIGLGPAGANLARLLDKSFKIVAIDKKRPNSNRGFRKPCGGLLATDAQKALAHFNLTLPKSVLVDPQIFAVKTIDIDTGYICNYQRFYINIDRHKFDMWMESIIGSHVTIFNDSYCENIEKTKDGFKITFLAEGEKKVIFSKYIVGADGANSIVRKQFYVNKKIRKYVSIQQWFKETHSKPFYSCIFDSKNTDCYSWSISKDGYFIFGGAYPVKDCKLRFENQKKDLVKYGFHFGQIVKTEACLVLRPSSFFDFCTGYDNAFLIGEAAGFISPSSLEGISSAIYSALFLSRVLNSRCSNPNKKYHKMTFGIRMKIYLKVLKCPFMYFPLLRKLVMKSGITNIETIEN